MSENDVSINLLDRAIQHIMTTARYSIYYGEGRDAYDVRGRTAHEIIFNVVDGKYRCPNAQQGFSGFTTWTRGLAWAMCGFAEELEFFNSYQKENPVIPILEKATRAVCDFYVEHTALDGIPYWDTGAPLLHKLGDYQQSVADPYNAYEPVDSSAATIAAQGLLRFGNYLKGKGDNKAGEYVAAGLTVAKTLLSEPYLSTDENHEGLILHSIYHRPNGWDHIPTGSKIPCGESSMWGDYHARELMLYITRMIRQEPHLSFYTHF